MAADEPYRGPVPAAPLSGPAAGGAAVPAAPGLTTRRTRIDIGRLLMVAGALVVLLIDVTALAHRPAPGASGALRLCGTVLAASFYAMTIWYYLRRRRAVATSTSVTAHAAAVIGTLWPFVFPLLPIAPVGPGRQVAADIVLVAGMAWSVWALRSLGRSLSVLAQARQVVERGPYRWVRHPLYTGELAANLGLAILIGSLPAAGVWLAMVALQAYRAVREEQLLLVALPGYRAYRSRTAALLPGVF
jgi:protein-S-isoprenylcysteine O-methyltransferase Ste14